MIPRKIVLKNLTKTTGREIFPRPDAIRNPSYSLDGEWTLCPDRLGAGNLKGWHRVEVAREIVMGRYRSFSDAGGPFPVRVPFPLESDINQKALAPAGYTPGKIYGTNRFWYFTGFKRPEKIDSGLLRFGAVDYRARVWLNGAYLGEHAGGYAPFAFPVRAFAEDNYLVVCVEDSGSMSQVRGKQTFRKKPFMVWYPGTTGIWQPVWIEPVGRVFIDHVSCRRESQNIVFSAAIKGFGESILADARVVFTVHPSQAGDKRGDARRPLKQFIEYARLDAFNNGIVDITVPAGLFDKWSPEWPVLHPAEAVLQSGGRDLDRVLLLFGSRDADTEGGVIRLNKKKFYQRLLLNQGYYPGGQYAPPDPDMFRSDVALMKNAGFNGCRMHQKIEDPRFLYWADLLGFVVWEEMPSYYLPSGKNLLRAERELAEMMRRDSLHPCVTTLVLFNESWGAYDLFVSQKAQNRLANFYRRTREIYPGYLVIDNSGFHHVETDVADIHHYIPGFSEVEEFYRRLDAGVREAPLWAPFLRMILGRPNIQTPFLKGCGDGKVPLFLSEFGGYGFGMYPTEAATLDEFFRKHLELIAQFPVLQGFCYTQFTDTYDEKNGLFTLERRPKLARIREFIQKARYK